MDHQLRSFGWVIALLMTFSSGTKGHLGHLEEHAATAVNLPSSTLTSTGGGQIETAATE
jgi:hypothetical protein